MNVYKQRLLNVVRALRESPEPHRFTMKSYSRCRTPACALGHYAFRTDLQDKFYLGEGLGLGPVLHGRQCIQSGLSCNSTEIQEHFGLNASEAYCLFNTSGCDNAGNAIAAADYLEKFAREKWPEPRRTDSELVSYWTARVRQQYLDEHTKSEELAW